MHPLLYVTLVGSVVKLQEFHDSIKFNLDDGTGSIGCRKWKNSSHVELKTEIKLGDLLRVQGRINIFNKKREIVVSKIVIENNIPNAEPLHWLEVISLTTDYYKKPFKIPKMDETMCLEQEKKSSNSNLALIESHLIEHPTEKISRDTVCNLLQIKQDNKAILVSTVNELVREGIILPFLNKNQELPSEFEVVGQHNLIQYIYDVIKKNSQEIYGIKLKQIREHVWAEKQFKFIKNAQIKSSTELLAENSWIYSVGDDEYKSTFDK